MKTTLAKTSQIFLLTLTVLVGFSAHAAEAAKTEAPAAESLPASSPVASAIAEETRETKLESKEDWKKFYQLCETDWDRFENKLRDVRTQLKKEIDEMPQKTYLDRYAESDPKITFISGYWPSDLAGKDKAWEFYKTCADLNWDARKALGQLGTPKAEREKKIGEVKDCFIARDTKNGPAEFPLDLMLACYEKHAGR